MQIEDPEHDADAPPPEFKPRPASRGSFARAQPDAREALRYRQPPHDLTKLLGSALWAIIALSAVALILSLLQYSEALNAPYQPKSFTVADDDGLGVEEIGGVVSILFLVVSLLAAVLFICWLYAGSKNSWGFGAEDLRYLPGTWVVWCLVPIANLFAPYLALKEIWGVSLVPQNWRNQGSPLVLQAWILCVVVGGALTAFLVHVWLGNFQPGPEVQMLVVIALYIQTALSAFLTLKITNQIVRNQDRLVG